MLRWLVNAVYRDLGLKLFSLLVATGLWLYVMNVEDPIRSERMDCVVEPVGIPSGLGPTKIRPERVEVTLRGRLSGLERARRSPVRVIADLSAAKAGHNLAKLSVINLPDRVTVQSVDRQSVHVWLDRQVTVRRRITPLIVGKLATGHEVLGSPRLQPEDTLVSGPAETVGQVAEVVVRLDVTGRTERTSLTGQVEALDASGKQVPGLAFDPDRTTAEVTIVRVRSKQVSVRPQLGDPPAGYVVAQVRVTPDIIRIKGQWEAIEKVKEISTAPLDITRLRSAGDYRVPLAFPSGVRPADDVRTVVVSVAVRPTAAQERPRTPRTEPRGSGSATSGATAPQTATQAPEGEAASGRSSEAETGEPRPEPSLAPAQAGSEAGSGSERTNVPQTGTPGR